MTLIVGLGNPGSQYENNRHNIGFLIVDALVKEYSANNISNKKFKGDLYKYRDILLLKPNTFMNLSGESVQSVCNFYNVDEIVVVHDDLDLTLGTLRYKKGGSSGGHNGLKSIDSFVGSDYIRVRFGIGKPQRKSEVSSYVLSDFSLEEETLVNKAMEISIEAIKNLMTHPLEYVKQHYSLKKISV